MVRPSMLVDFPGLTKEELPSGQIRWRVRPKGEHRKRITISAAPGEEDFGRQYLLARAGHQPEPMKKASEVAKPRSIGWLVAKYFEYLDERIKAGTFSAKTLKKKRNLFGVATGNIGDRQ